MAQPDDGQRYELVIEGDVEVIPGPLSQIRIIAETAIADPDCPDEARRKLAGILDVIDGVQP
jgi:hypothetical protein